MKAMRLNEWGQPVQLEDIPQPKPGNDEVLVRVHAASINPFDAFVLAGYMQGMMSIPLTAGTDFAGEVVEVGPEVTHVKPGDAVYGLVAMHSGSFAEYLVAKATEVTHKPKKLSFVEAAGVPLASLAAYQSLFDLGQAQKGERVLVIGGGSVGGCTIQLAKELGVYVYAVTIPEKADFVRGLGADRYIDSKAERFEDVVGTVDLVLDYVGGENVERAYSVLQPGGRYVTSLLLTPQQQEEAGRRGIRAIGLATQSRVDHLDELARRIDSDRLKIFVNRTFQLDEAQAALEYRLKKTSPGKVVLTVI